MFFSQRLLAAIAISFVTVIPVSAALTPYTAQDTGVGPGVAFPNSTAAAATYLAAAPRSSLVTFETSPVGTFTSLLISPGVTVTGTNAAGTALSVNNTPDFPAAPALDGFNTTSGGANYIEMAGGTVTFNFTTPINAFGCYVPGVQTSFFPDVLTFNDGLAESISLPGIGTSSSTGALDFVGFSDPGASIKSVSLSFGTNSTGYDAVGIDDLRFQQVPEPATLGIAIPAMAIGLLRRRVAR